MAGVNAGKYTKCGAGYTDWHLPNVNELESLVNAEKANSAAWLNSQGLANAAAYVYWSSTTGAFSTGVARAVDMRSGYVLNFSKGLGSYVLPVRAGRLSGSSVILREKRRK